MQNEPLVSIVTPSFNQARFLEQAIKSVIGQDYPNIEYFVIDGGSTDGSVDIIKAYASGITSWVSERDRGQADGINKGLRKCKGEIVAWLNSDDRYTPGAIRRAVQAYQAHKEASFIFSDVESIDCRGNGFNLMRYGHWGLADLLQFKIIGQPGVFMNRKFLKAAGYLDESYHYLLDHELWLRMAALAEPAYIPNEVWAQARIHDQAKNVAGAANFGPEAFRLAHWIGNDQRFFPSSGHYHRRIWGGAYCLNAFYLVDAGEYKSALKFYHHSFKLYPWPVLKQWRHYALALAGLLGLHGLKKPYELLRGRCYTKKGGK